ncbi:MAG: CDP-alcohol phosphatidyltransferase family protein [Deltaproteobacteria bacterium]
MLRDELLLPANLLSLARVPLGVAAIVMRAHPVAILALVAAAALSDVLDGRVARRAGGDHTVGAWLDPVCDKAFVLAVVIGIWIERRPPAWILLALMARDALIVPPVLVHFATHGRRARALEFRARPLGKATTVVQFMVIVAVMLGRIVIAGPLAVLAGVLGVAAAADYAVRARGHRSS